VEEYFEFGNKVFAMLDLTLYCPKTKLLLARTAKSKALLGLNSSQNCGTSPKLVTKEK
jgi:hypothetical protein